MRRDPRFDRSTDRRPRAGDPVLLDGVQEDPAAVLHRGLPGLGTPTRGRVTRSSELYHRARELLPGGVNSPVRAMRSIGREPVLIARGEGAILFDVDVKDYGDWVSHWAWLIVGHAHRAVVDA